MFAGSHPNTALSFGPAAGLSEDRSSQFIKVSLARALARNL